MNRFELYQVNFLPSSASSRIEKSSSSVNMGKRVHAIIVNNRTMFVLHLGTKLGKHFIKY